LLVPIASWFDLLCLVHRWRALLRQGSLSFHTNTSI
jgi:hypothetical protein